jgi:hypothetical protein
MEARHSIQPSESSRLVTGKLYIYVGTSGGAGIRKFRVGKKWHRSTISTGQSVQLYDSRQLSTHSADTDAGSVTRVASLQRRYKNRKHDTTRKFVRILMY